MSENQKNDIDDILHGLSIRYSSDIYTTLISVVQGLAIATLLMMFDKLFISGPPREICSYATLSVVLKMVTCFFVICLVWHRYIISNQFHTWMLGPVDTVIPFCFSVLQAILIYVVPLEDSLFLWTFSLLTLLGLWAYQNVITQHSHFWIRAWFEQHYDKPAGIGMFLYDEMKSYAEKGRKHMTIYAIFFILLCVISLKYSAVSIVIIFIALLSTMYELFWADFRRNLKKSFKQRGLNDSVSQVV